MTENQKIEALMHVSTLIQKAAFAHDSADAMRFAQAALNAANAILGLTHSSKI